MRRGLQVLGLIVLFGLLVVPRVMFAEEVKVAEMDSILVHITAADESKDENGKLQVTLTWQVFKKTYNKRRGTYSDWEQIREPTGFTFAPEVATDSAFNNIAAKTETDQLTYTFKGLDWGTHYWWRVRLVSPQALSRCDFAEGILYKHAAVSTGKKKGLVARYLHFVKQGGLVFMIPMHLLLLFGLVTWVLIWRRLWLANVFPPNKPNLSYRLLPVDRVGKTEINSEKGNIFLREVAKYWSKAMEAMSIGPEHFGSVEEYIKADRQKQEELEKKLWVEMGLPNVEKAIEICRNGVPGIKLPKKPLEYPTVRVLLAALENHRANKNNFWASQEMDRAAENTVMKELDELKGWEVTALWAVGSIEPMLGLFGTVVGIRQSFGKIQETIATNPNAQLTQIVPSLAGGIHVALITTILGLTFGIPMMLVHYYYRGKIDWIFGKWEEIMTDILNQA